MGAERRKKAEENRKEREKIRREEGEKRVK